MVPTLARRKLARGEAAVILDEMRLVIAMVCAWTSVSVAAPADDLGAAFAAYDANDLAGARDKLVKIDERAIVNRDYLWWLRGMVALRSDRPGEAQAAFEKVSGGSRFAREIPWRLADVAWARGDKAGAAAAYSKLITVEGAGDLGDVGTAKFRIAESKTGKAALAAYRIVVIEHPAHPLAPRAEAKLVELGAPPLTHTDRIERAKQLTAAHLWDEAVAELSLLPAKLPGELTRQRDYWLGTTLFKMRRRYGDAGKLLLGVYKDMGGNAAEAMFHGARALSRADKDDDAIVWYRKVVSAYPGSAYAEEAAFLAGWLEFNRGKYKDAIPPLEASLKKYPKSKWVDDALWNLGMAHYFLGE
jgi:tetratricopeptide (TPR) repeat protein